MKRSHRLQLVLLVVIAGGCHAKQPPPKAKPSVTLAALERLLPGTGPEQVREALKEFGPAAHYDSSIFADVAHPWFDKAQISIDSSTGVVSSWALFIRQNALNERTREPFANALESLDPSLLPKRKTIEDQILGTYQYEYGLASDGRTDLMSLDFNWKKMGDWSGTVFVCTSVTGPVCTRIARALTKAMLPPP
jgi:hypothetical protein